MSARRRMPGLTPDQKAVILGDKPAITICPAGTDLELVMNQDQSRIVAVLIPQPISLLRIQTLYALGAGTWSNCMPLVKQWRCWGVLADPAWADLQARSRAPRPAGIKFTFTS